MSALIATSIAPVRRLSIQIAILLVTATLLNRQIRHCSKATVPAPHLETYRCMRIQKTLAALCSLFVAQSLTLAAFAVEVTEPAGAAHGYPGLCDINGKKLA